MGWALFLASLSSLEVECLSPLLLLALFELLALGQVTKQDSITGRWNLKRPRLPPYVRSRECVCLRGSHPYLSYILNLILYVLRVFLPVCCTPPSLPWTHPFPVAPTSNCLLSHTPQTSHMYGLCFKSRCYANSPLSCLLAVGESDLSPLCLPLVAVDHCRLHRLKSAPRGARQEKTTTLAPK